MLLLLLLLLLLLIPAVRWAWAGRSGSAATAAARPELVGVPWGAPRSQVVLWICVSLALRRLTSTKASSLTVMPESSTAMYQGTACPNLLSHKPLV